MATQNPDDPNATRIRNNQRRSRARRREYTQELESRVREYEIKGVKVAQEIQDAAKAVVEENRQLRRALDDLRRVNGQSIHNTELKHSDEKVEELQRTLRRAGNWSDPILGNAEGRGLKRRKLDAAEGNAQLISPASTANSALTPSTSPTAANLGCGPRLLQTPSQHHGFHSGSPVHTLHRDRDHPATLPGIANLHTPPKVSSSKSESKTFQALPLQQEVNSADDTSSCAFAVAILTNMRADISAEEVRADLGCATDLDKCKVDNKRLFGTVDRYTG